MREGLGPQHPMGGGGGGREGRKKGKERGGGERKGREKKEGGKEEKKYRKRPVGEKRVSEKGTDPSPPCLCLGGTLPPTYKVVLGPQQPCHHLALPDGQHNTDFYVEGLAFPDADFPGLISLGVSLLDTSNPVGQAGAAARLGGWRGAPQEVVAGDSPILPSPAGAP